MNKLVVISGCSGGGKSTLLGELRNRGYSVVEEPGRRIIAEEWEAGGRALPWIDVEAFARRAIAMSMEDIASCAERQQWVFFDRGLIDAASGLSHITGEPISRFLNDCTAYHRKVFLTPPWPKIYAVDADRRHTFSDAVEEYERLVEVYPAIGYEIDILPRTTVQLRADYVLQHLNE